MEKHRISDKEVINIRDRLGVIIDMEFDLSSNCRYWYPDRHTGSALLRAPRIL